MKRKEAIAKGFKTYHGRPCKYGHVVRYTSCSQCIECSAGLRQRWRKENHERVLETDRAWREKNRKRLNAKVSQRYYANQEAMKAKSRREGKVKSLRGQATINEYNEIANGLMGGLCAICGEPEVVRRDLAMDHCHKTGLLRAPLCSKCNGGLGLFTDSVEKLESAIRYLKVFRLASPDSRGQKELNWHFPVSPCL